MKKFHTIFAMDSVFGIGRRGVIPWGRIPADLSFFRQVTTRTRLGEYPVKQNVVIMGRKTWESIPEESRPLQNRVNVVVSRNREYTIQEGLVTVFHSLTEALLVCLANEQYGEVFVIGGGEVYNEALSDRRLGELYVTEIGGVFQCDTFVDQTLIDQLRFHTAELICESTVVIDSAVTPLKFYRMTTYQHADRVYGDLCRRILLQGETITGRNGCTRRVCGDIQLAFSLMDGLPVLTGKKILWSKVVEELLFFIRGQTDTKQLEAAGVRFWQGNTSREFLDSRGLEYPEGEMGPMYGFQWRNFNGEYTPGQQPCSGFDQLSSLITELQSNGASRRLLMTTFNPTAVDESVLWPCHGLVVQFFVDTGDGLSCKMYQRSADTFLGLPFNMASYALLTCILARLCGYTPRTLFITIGDCHLYDNHTDAVHEYLLRVPYESPHVAIAEHIQTLADVEASTSADYPLIDYQHHAFIRAPMSA